MAISRRERNKDIKMDFLYQTNKLLLMVQTITYIRETISDSKLKKKINLEYILGLEIVRVSSQ